MKASIIISALSPVFALCGVGLGFWLTTRREKINRRMLFQNHLQTVIVQLEETREEDIENFYTASRLGILVECAKIRRDISCCERSRFDATRADYSKLMERAAKEGSDFIRERFTTGTHTQSGGEIPYPSKSEADERPIRQKIADTLQILLVCAT